MNTAKALATWFGSGLMKPAPGTWGSAAALPFAWVALWLGGWTLLAAMTIMVFAVGIWAAGEHCRTIGREDAGEVVIDEVAGQWLTLLVAGLSWQHFLAGFLLFRLFDITKPPPARQMDRAMKGGFGVMIDDIVAGLYAAIVLWLLIWLKVL